MLFIYLRSMILKVAGPCSTWNVVYFYIFINIPQFLLKFYILGVGGIVISLSKEDTKIQILPSYLYDFYKPLILILLFYINNLFYFLFYLLIKIL